MVKIRMGSKKIFVLAALMASSICTSKAAADDCLMQEATCCDQNDKNVFVRADVLYWRPYVSGLELNFGSGSILQTIDGCSQVIESEEFDTDPHFDWDAGYRIAGGFGSACSWGACAEWTHFRGKGHRSSFDNGDLTSAGKFNVKLDQIDLVLGYPYEINSQFNVKPFMGVRGAHIKDSVDGLITTQITINDVTDGVQIRRFDHRQDYHAIGAILGIQGDYNLGCGFGVYGTAAASLLYGKYKVRFDDATLIDSIVDNEIFTSNRRHVYSFDPNIDLGLGIFWRPDFLDCVQLEMKLGFEHHEYFNQNHLSVFRGDMSFSGGIFSIEIVL